MVLVSKEKILCSYMDDAKPFKSILVPRFIQANSNLNPKYLFIAASPVEIDDFIKPFNAETHMKKFK